MKSISCSSSQDHRPSNSREFTALEIPQLDANNTRYTRSENTVKGRKPTVLETRNDISYDFSKKVRASEEGTYEVVSIKDKHCSYSVHESGKAGQKLLQF